MTLAEIEAMHDRMTDRVAYMKGRTKTCTQCTTHLLPDSVFCHRCGRRVVAKIGPASSEQPELVTVKLHGLYDDKRREELALALIPIRADLSRTIDMTNVEHIDIAALTSLVPLLEAREREYTAPIDVLGMNDDVYKTLTRTGLAKFVRCI
jgi:anti-anti-sigma regulatory factor